MSCGLPWSILRPSRLTDGPYTSYDVNTLLQATAGSRQDVQVSPKDDLAGEASRIAVAGVGGGMCVLACAGLCWPVLACAGVLAGVGSMG